MLHYDKARSIARHLQNHRPGAVHLTGCLRTRGDWGNWDRRYRSKGGRRVRTAGSALLSEIVAAHKAGLIDVPELSSSRLTIGDKLEWLSSLGAGEFTRSQWDHMSKRNRREKVLRDANMDEVRALVDKLNREEEEEMSDSHAPFVNDLAGGIANADLPDMEPAIKAINEMKAPQDVAASPDFERLDEVVKGVEEARAKRARREAEKQSKERAAEAAARPQRRKPKHRFVPRNPSTEPGPEGPEMEL